MYTPSLILDATEACYNKAQFEADSGLLIDIFVESILMKHGVDSESQMRDRVVTELLQRMREDVSFARKVSAADKDPRPFLCSVVLDILAELNAKSSPRCNRCAYLSKCPMFYAQSQAA